MDHIAQIAGKLADHQLDAMLLASQAGERYAVGFHGEGLVLVTREGAHYSTDSRYIEAARQEGAGAQVELVTREQGPSGPGRRLSPGARPEAGGL